jgi:hypothetical protein
MARRSLRPHLNQIRTWVRQGRTDAWIAYQLETTVPQIAAFKREQGLAEGEAAPATDFDDEIDLRAEDDARIAAEIEAAEAEAEESDDDDDSDDDDGDGESAEERAKSRRRRGRRGGRGRGKRSAALEGTFDHGEEGYGLWLDPAIQDDPTYAEHWAGHRPVEVVVEAEQLIIRRVGDGPDENGDED